jgi:methionyl-tRNA formyltransferase
MVENFASKRIVFLGTPEFAVASLAALTEAGLNIVAVVTAPDKPAGRGMKPKSSAVKLFAISKQIPVLQPEKLKDTEFQKALAALQPDLQVVVAFRMLPEVIWNLPPMGTVNLHASLLPQYRGAAPINWAVINGEKETGLTTFQLQHAIDTGDILLQEKIAIGEEETAGELHDRMMIQGGALMMVTVKGLFAGTLQPTSQETFLGSQTTIHHAPKITRDACRIDWSKSTQEVFNFVRGLAPHYGAFTVFNDKMLKIFRSKTEISPVPLSPGLFTTDYQTYLKYACADGYLSVTELQMEGKKKMSVEEFLRGFRVM